MARLPRPSLPALAGLAVLALTLAVYAGTLSHAFTQWDDGNTIWGNPRLGDLDLAHLVWAFTDVATTMRWIPLTLLSLCLTHTLHGLDPFGYHLANWLLHGAAALVLFLLLLELLRPAAAGRGLGPTAPWVVLAAAAGALSWSLHPLRAEVEAWSNSRGHAQATLFAFLALLAYLRTFRPEALAPRAWRGVALSAAWLLCALLSHPVALGVAPVFVLLDLHLGRLGGQAGWWSPAARRAWLEKLPFAAVAVAVVVVTLVVRAAYPGRWDPPVPLSAWGLFPRAMQATFIWVQYAVVTVWPVGLQPAPTDLIDFDPWSATFLLRAVLVVAVTSALLLLRRRWPAALLLWLAWLSLLVPALGLTEHPMFACDRYASIAGLVPAVLVAALALRLGDTAPRRRGVAAALAVLLTALGAQAQAQAATWRNSVALFEHMLPLLGDHPYRVNVLHLLALVHLDEGRPAEALQALVRAAEVEPRAVDVRANMGSVLVQLGQLDEGIGQLRLAVSLDPRSVDYRCRLGDALVKAGRSGEALAQLAMASRLDPGAFCVAHLSQRLQGERPR